MSGFEFKTKSNKLPNSASPPATKSLYGATAFEPASTVMPPLQLRESPFYSPQSPLMPQRKVKNPAAVQLSKEKADDVKPETIHQAAATGVQGTGSKLPHFERIQQSFGRFDVTQVQAYSGSPQAAAASKAMGAEAYAVGTKVVFKDSQPDLHTAAHEAAHTIQQRSGVHLKNGVGVPGDSYEQHADRVADAVVQGRSAEHLLSNKSNAVIGNQVQKIAAVQMMLTNQSPLKKHKKEVPKEKPKEEPKKTKESEPEEFEEKEWEPEKEETEEVEDKTKGFDLSTSEPLDNFYDLVHDSYVFINWQTILTKHSIPNNFNSFLIWRLQIEDAYQLLQSGGADVPLGKKNSYRRLNNMEKEIRLNIKNLYPKLRSKKSNEKEIKEEVDKLGKLLKEYNDEAQDRRGLGLTKANIQESNQYKVDSEAKKNQSDYHLGTESDPIPIVWYKNTEEDYKPIKLTAKAAAENDDEDEIKFPDEFTLKDGGKKYKFGVDPDNISKKGYDKLKKTKHDSKREVQKALNKIINANTDDMLTKEKLDGDHVKDLGFGGEDKINNYWPLDANINRRAFMGYNRNYAVHYKKMEGGNPIVKIAPIGFLYDKWFEVKDYMKEDEKSVPEESGKAEAGKK